MFGTAGYECLLALRFPKFLLLVVVSDLNLKRSWALVKNIIPPVVYSWVYTERLQGYDHR